MTPATNATLVTTPVASPKPAQPAPLRTIALKEAALAEVRRHRFARHLASAELAPLRRDRVTTVQVNLGKLCNQACHHCHVEAGPHRTENMTEDVALRVATLIERTPSIEVVDLTGGAPELNPNFRWLVKRFRARGLTVIDRCNLTVFFEPGMGDLPAFLAEQRVRVTASLPCYTADNVDAQRGDGVFEKSIRALRILNALGYGDPGSGLELDLVYNPGGAFLPPAQAPLEERYRLELRERFDLGFSRLLTLTNLPVKRFAEWLARRGELAAYMELLVQSFNPVAVPSVMCRSMISVGWDGQLYDCDFNQMLELPIAGLRSSATPSASGGARRTVFAIDSFEDLASAQVATGGHCFGCTAGTGSSCGGALA